MLLYLHENLCRPKIYLEKQRFVSLNRDGALFFVWKYTKIEPSVNACYYVRSVLVKYRHEVVIPNKDLPFKIFPFEGEEGNYYRDKHWHRSIEIFALFEGSMNFLIDEQKYMLSADADDYIIVNSNEIHGIDAPVSNKTVVVQIPLKAFENYFTDEQYIRFTHLNVKGGEQVTRLIGEMFRAYQIKDTGYELAVQSHYYQLLHLLVTAFRETEIDQTLLKQHKNLNRLSTITNYVKENYNSDLSLESLGELFGYSSSYLSRIFQKYANINFKSYLQNIRLEYGFQELIHTENTISEISINSGFPNNKAFSKAFFAKYGELPSDYRKKINK